MLFTASAGLSLAHKVIMIFHITHMPLLAEWVNIFNYLVLYILNFSLYAFYNICGSVSRHIVHN